MAQAGLPQFYEKGGAFTNANVYAVCKRVSQMHFLKAKVYVREAILKTSITNTGIMWRELTVDSL